MKISLISLEGVGGGGGGGGCRIGAEGIQEEGERRNEAAFLRRQEP